MKKLLGILVISLCGEAFGTQQSYWAVGSFRTEQHALMEKNRIENATGLQVLTTSHSASDHNLYRLLVEKNNNANEQRQLIVNAGISPWTINIEPPKNEWETTTPASTVVSVQAPGRRVPAPETEEPTPIVIASQRIPAPEKDCSTADCTGDAVDSTTVSDLVVSDPTTAMETVDPPILIDRKPLDIRVGGGYWQVDFDGDVIDNVQLDRDFSIREDDGGYGFIAVEHSLRLLPNVMFAYANISDSANSTLTRDFVFNGIAFTANQEVETDFDLTHTDLTLYYAIPNVGYDLNIGITARNIDGELTISGVHEDIVATFPLAYISARFGLPSGFYVGTEINGSSDILDYRLTLGWLSEPVGPLKIGVALGYRNFDVHADEDSIDVDLDLETDGLLLEVNVLF